MKPAEVLYTEGKREQEILERRRENAKTFYLGKRRGKHTFKTVVNAGPIHYKAGKRWKEIDLSFYHKKNTVVMDRASYRVEILRNKIGYKAIFADGSWYKIALVGKNRDPKIHYEGNQFFWDNVEKHIDIKLQLQPHKPEIFTQIKKKCQIRTLVWKITESKEFTWESYGGDMDQNNLEILVKKSPKIGRSFLYEETFTGRVSRRFDKKTRMKRWEFSPAFPLVIASEPKYPIFIDPTITKTVGANADDGFDNGGNWKTSKIIVGHSGHYLFQPGVRFTSVGVPAGATITAATLKLTTKSGGGTQGVTKIFGDKVANAAAWSQTSRPSQITKTTASTNWTPSLVVGQVNSIAVTNQVASIVGLGGWVSNNAMRFGGLSQTTVGLKDMYVYDHNTNAAKCAKLVITYTAGGGAVPKRKNLTLLGIG